MSRLVTGSATRIARNAASALAQPLGQREQRRRGVALAHQHAGHRLPRQRERPTERPVTPAGRRPAARPATRVPGPTGSTTTLESGAERARGADPVIHSAAPGEPAGDGDGDEVAGAGSARDAGA